MMAHSLPVAGKLPTKTLVARQLPTNMHTYIHMHAHMHARMRTHTHTHTHTEYYYDTYYSDCAFYNTNSSMCALS